MRHKGKHQSESTGGSTRASAASQLLLYIIRSVFVLAAGVYSLLHILVSACLASTANFPINVEFASAVHAIQFSLLLYKCDLFLPCVPLAYLLHVGHTLANFQHFVHWIVYRCTTTPSSLMCGPCIMFLTCFQM